MSKSTATTAASKVADRNIKVRGAQKEYADGGQNFASNEVITSALQIVPQITTTNGVPTMYQPLAFIIFVSALRAGMEDWNKHKADRKRNGYQYGVLTASGFQMKASGDIKVGDIVKVMENDMIPSDCIFLGSAHEKGHCFIDKANLNGETKLEVMTCHATTKQFCNNEEDMQNFDFSLIYEPPNKRFDQFRGNFVINGEEFAVDGKVLLMRETNLRNCAFIYGLVVYTGNDTKIQVSNSEGGKARVKVSWIMRQVNVFLRYMLLFQLILCSGGAIGASVFVTSNRDAWYMDMGSADENEVGGFGFLTWFILLSQMVPISLIVSAEMVKFVMSVFIQWDFMLYYPLIDKPTKCNSSTIHEDMGLIDYIFSDKTGTLTQNKMEFRYLMLNVGEWGSKETEIAKSVKRRKDALKAGAEPQEYTLWTDLVQPLHATRQRPYEPDCIEARCNCCWGEAPPSDDIELNHLSANEFSAAEREVLMQALWGPPADGESIKDDTKKKKMLKRYMRHMALSNTIKSYYDEGELKFQAESAEELAMVSFARTMGFTKVSNNPTVLEIQTYDVNMQAGELITETYNHVATFGFTSKRARVTVVLQNADTHDVVVMNKGQDTVILPLCENPEGHGNALMLELNAMSANGLRTLVATHAEHPAAWWEERAGTYQELVVMEVTPDADGHSAGKCNSEKCVHCCQHEWFEKVEMDANLQFLGVVGMEDQLQLLVPEAIKDFLRAGIRVWMITGDKLETAKNIGLACNLIDPDMSPQLRDGDTLEDAANAFSASRLIEVTGSWASLANDQEELAALFSSLDHNADGTVSVAALGPTLSALKCNVSQKDLQQMFLGKKFITEEQFVQVLQGSPIQMYEAVKADIDAGYAVYEGIDNHERYPVSILVNRGAFQTMFPGKGARPENSEGKTVTEEELEELRARFFHLANNCKSVVFARAQPAMKKKMVTEIQKRVPAALTLAIGDGANDTDMIMAAHIGVGIAGVEGTAATNSADYAIGTFRMLHTLLFKHGFWSYIRVSKLVYFIFYKASLLAVSMYIFGPFSGWSGQQLFNDPPYQLYNVCYTALPVMMVAIFDKVLTGEDAENNPVVYRATRGTAFTKYQFAGWVARAFFHCVIMFGVPFLAMGEKADFNTTSIVVFQCVALVPSFLIMFLMENITFLHGFIIFLSVGALLLFNFALGHWLSYNPDLYGVMDKVYSDGYIWAVIFITVMIPLLLELAGKGLHRHLQPSVAHVLKEKAYLQDLSLASTRVHPDDSHQEADKSKSRVKRLLTRTEEKAIVVKAEESVLKPVAPDGAIGRSKSALQRAADNKAVVNTILRFRKLTGSQFDSAAQAKFQNHDAFQVKNAWTDENIEEVQEHKEGYNKEEYKQQSPRSPERQTSPTPSIQSSHSP